MKKEILTFLIDVLNSEGQFTNWHWNSNFLTFCDRFCNKDLSIKKCRAKLQRYMKHLSDSGVCRCERNPLGAGSMNTYGSRTQTTWVKTIKSEINFDIIK